MKCLYCQKDTEGRADKKFCDDNCKMAYHRKQLSVTKVVPVTVTGELSVTEKVLIFPPEMPLEERIQKFKEAYPDYTFVPNWIAHGFLSKDQAMEHAMKKVRESAGVTSSGFDIE